MDPRFRGDDIIGCAKIIKVKNFKKIFGTKNERDLKKIKPLVDQINALESAIAKLSDYELSAKTIEFRKRLENGEALDALLPEAFAVVREASKRVLQLRHFDEQLIGGIVLHRGRIAEMKTGEGKTLVATLIVALNALGGRGVHVVTVNDYLAKRDVQWMGPIYQRLGLSVGCIQHEAAFVYDPEYSTDDQRTNNLRPVERSAAYRSDITCGTNNEFGFDYLRDNMAPDYSLKVQRDLNYAIVDEVDSILIDEARTPLIISAPAEESTDQYFKFASLIKQLNATEDFNIDEKMRSATLTESG